MYRMFVVTIKIVFFFSNIKGCLEMTEKWLIAVINISYFFDVLINFNTGIYFIKNNKLNIML